MSNARAKDRAGVLFARVSCHFQNGRKQEMINEQFVAQIVNLLYRRLEIGSAGASSMIKTACGLAIRDTADCQSALRRRGNDQ